MKTTALSAPLFALLLAAGVTAEPPDKGSARETKGPDAGEALRRFKPPADAKEAALAADWLEKTFAGGTTPESVKMLVAILRGSRMGPGEGWFGPAQTRYTWRWLAAHCGAGDATAITQKQFKGPPAVFAALDRDKDGRITPGDLDWSDKNPWVQQSYLVNRLFRRIDPNGDGKVTREELLQFFDKAAAGKGHLTSDDLRNALLAGEGGGFSPGDAPTRDQLVRGLFAGEIGSLQEGPAVGQSAPRFTLQTVDGKETVQIEKLIGPRPLVLVFGNFTCGPFRSLYPAVEAVHQRHKKDATFLMVYVREAHPTDGWKMASNTRAGVALKQPTTLTQRRAAAGQFCHRLKPSMPVVVDGINDPVGNAYSGMPARLYVIDSRGKVAYKSGRGPFGFRAGEMEQALHMALLEQAKAAAVPRPAPGGPAKAAAFVPLLSNDEAWKRLPRPQTGGGQALPAWARATARALPHTTAAMLELDYLHRVDSPLPARLRGMMRWTAAHANRCPCTQEQALADLRLAGVGPANLDLLRKEPGKLPAAERDAVAFARQMTRAAYTVTDAEVAALIKAHGEAAVVAMVQLLAYANFQDRLILSLGLGAQAPLPALRVTFPRRTAGEGPTAPARAAVRPPAGPGPATKITDEEWLALDYKALQKNLTGQRARAPRIRVPKPKDPTRKGAGIRWTLVCSGYQPKLAQGWGACTGSFREDARQDRAFEELQFWVVTRSLHCFY
jgi:alkylhydroperoxidase family enzyme